MELSYNLPTLSEGLVENFSTNKLQLGIPSLILQVLHVRNAKIGGDINNIEHNTKLVISDGTHIIAVYVKKGYEGEISQQNRLNIIEINEYEIVYQNSKKYLVISKFKVIACPTGKIGNPSDEFVKKGQENNGVGSANRNVQSNQIKQDMNQVQNTNVNSFGQNNAAFNQQPLQVSNNPFTNSPFGNVPNRNPFTNQPPQSVNGGGQGFNTFNSGGQANQQTDFINISELNPFKQKTTFRAMISLKTEIKNYKNQKGDGKLCNVHFLDNSGEIRATAFNAEVDKFYDLLEVGKMYQVSGFKVGNANKKFSPLKGDYELTFQNATNIIPINDSIPTPRMRYDFVKLSDIEPLEVNTLIDVIGLIKEVSDMQAITSKTTGKELHKREVTLVDNSMCAIRLTLWDNKADTFDATSGSILACRSVRVGEFQGKNISTTSDSVLSIDPDIDEAYALQTWMGTIQPDTDFSSLASGDAGVRSLFDSPLKRLNEIKDQPNFAASKAEYFTVYGVVTSLLGSLTYPACPKEGCGKKVTQESGDQYHCVKCNRNYPNVNYRYIATCRVCDDLEDIYAQIFDPQARDLIGMDANDFEQIRNDSDQLNRIMAQINHTPVLLSIMAKRETYNDIERIRYNIRGIKLYPYADSNKALLDSIKQYI